MKRCFLLVILWCPLHLLASFQEATVIIPTPQQVTTKQAKFKITSSTKIVLGTGTSREDGFAASQVNHQLAEMGGPYVKTVDEESLRRFTPNFVYMGTPESERGKEFLKERRGKLTEDMRGEGYFLDVTPDGVVIIAHSAAGRFYGVMSLLQLVERQKKSLVVPGVSIHDWPLQKVRGITDDLSRGQVSTFDNFKKIIRFLSRYKLNVYSPYIEDIFTFKSHPLIGRGRGELTAKEMQELDQYAKTYHVELIPIFETLGHWENILALPEYVKYAEFPGAHTVNISDERVYKILDEMIGEIADAFSSPYFNIAADESWDVGLGANKQRVAGSDIATVHAEHYKRLFEILKKHKKKPLMYGDIILTHPSILDKIPKDVIIVDWQYYVSDNYGSPAIFKAAGFPFVVSPAVWNFTGPFPNFVNTFVNIQNLNREGFLNGSMGIHTSNWNDYGGEALRELNYYGYAWTAECAWQPLRANASDFNRRFFADFFGSAAAAEPALTVYALLSNPLNLFTWHELWRHPMLPPVPASNALWRIQNIRANMPLVQRLIQQVRSSATRNTDHLLYLEFVEKLNLWFAGKLETGEAVRKLTQNIPPSARRDSIQRAALEMTKDVADELTKLKTGFRRLWLTTNRDANLNWLLMRYDRQIAYWTEKSEELKRGDLWVDPLIESKWIYHPKANPRMRDTTVTQVSKAYFRQSFSVDDTATGATLQLIGDTQAKIWLNGSQLGEVFARHSLSLSVEHQRVKVWDISKKLKKGKNIIAVETANYDPFGSAGINVYAELSSPAKGFTKLLSDSTWRVSELSATGWANPEFSDAPWPSAKVFPHPSPIIRPNFSTNRSSWIERQ